MDGELKVVIFCGGKGTRLGEKTKEIPKPLVLVGGKPILWHIMKNYEAQGFKNFILCLGYKGELIRDYFSNYQANSSDFTVNLGTGEIKYHDSPKEDWNVTLVDTGLESETGLRLGKIRKHLDGVNHFMVTYGDGVSDVDLNEVFDFHKKNNTLGTITGFREKSRYGKVKVEVEGIATSFVEKPILEDWINGGFMVFDRAFLDHPLLNENVTFESILEDLTRNGELSVYQHEGFFHSMDTIRDNENLNRLWESKETPWKKW